MRSLAWLLLVFAAAIGLALMARHDNGLVLLIVPPYRVEMSLTLFLAASVVLLVLLYAVSRVLHYVLSMPVRVRGYRQRRTRERAVSALTAALKAYYEGRFARAEKSAAQAHDAGFAPGLAAIVGARAAHQMRDYARRDAWLEQAAGHGAELGVVRALTVAELALEDRDFDKARETLNALNEEGARHIATQRLLLRAERGAGNWEAARRIAQQLAKRDAISPALADEVRVQANLALLAADAGDAQAFGRRWKSLSTGERVEPRVALAGARHASALGAVTLAREIIEKGLAEEWQAGLVTCYGELARADAALRRTEAGHRIERAEKWLRQRAEDPQLLAALGSLCMHAELWGKAQSYLEAALALEDTREGRLALARLFVRLEKPDLAAEQYRRAAERG